MGIKVFRNGAWEEIANLHEEEDKEIFRSDQTKNSFVELGTGFSLNSIEYCLSNHKRMLAGVAYFKTNSPLKVNSKYYIGFLFPEFGEHLQHSSTIYNCGISLYSSPQTFFPAIIWSEVFNKEKRKLTITPLFPVAVSSTDDAVIRVDFIYNLSSPLLSDYVDKLFNKSA